MLIIINWTYIIYIQIYTITADSKLLSPKLESDVSNMDPDILMNSMERITLLYKALRQCKSRENKHIVSSALKYFLRETLPPAATLSRVVIEYLECCKETETKYMGLLTDRDRWIECSVLNSEIVFEVRFFFFLLFLRCSSAGIPKIVDFENSQSC